MYDCGPTVYRYAHVGDLRTHLLSDLIRRAAALREQAFREGLIHKLHVARPYDDVAGLLGEEHYDALAAVSVDPFPGRVRAHARR